MSSKQRSKQQSKQQSKRQSEQQRARSTPIVTPHRFVLGAVLGVGALGGSMLPFGASSAAAAPGISALFAHGVLTVVGDATDNTITLSRDAAGTILVNGGAVPIRGGVATVANTKNMSAVAGDGNDVVTIDEVNGAVPRANLIGGSGNDTLTGGSSNDTLVGQAGNDVLLGKGGADQLFGGAGPDTLTGGTGDDRSFGEAGNDRLIWNPGEGSDVNEGGSDVDTVEVNGGNGAEQFTATANGTRVRFDRVTPAPFFLDIGTAESLVLNANGGDDSFTGTGNLAPLIAISVDGGLGNDTLSGSNGIDRLSGGDGNDFVDGQQGNDVVLLGIGDDTFQWDPGDASDVVEGQDGVDTMLFNGANIAETFDVSANGERVRFSRNIANITMDMNDVEQLRLNAFGGADVLTVNDLTGTDLVDISTDLASPPNSGATDGSADEVIVNATNGDDVVSIGGDSSTTEVLGLTTRVAVTGADPTTDRVTVNALAGDDVVDASGVAVGAAKLRIDGGIDDDVLIGGDGDDTLLGNEGDDVLIGGPGVDTLDGGAGDNVLIDGEFFANGVLAGREWLASHTELVGNDTVLRYAGVSFLVPVADLTPASAPTAVTEQPVEQPVDQPAPTAP